MALSPVNSLSLCLYPTTVSQRNRAQPLWNIRHSAPWTCTAPIFHFRESSIRFHLRLKPNTNHDSPQGVTMPPSPLAPIAPVNQYPSRGSTGKSKQRLQPIPPIGKTPRQHHPKDDSVSITTTFTCQWVASPASGPCGKELISREQMMNHINKDHKRVETKTHRWCLWEGCEYSGDTPLSTSSSFNNHLKNVHLKVGESSARGRKPTRFKPYPTRSH